MESINRLRRYVECHDKITGLTATCINHLIDSIENEVDDMWHALTIDAKPMTDENMSADGWIRLPIDADGVPIHVGDVMEERSGHTFEAASLMAFGGSDNWLVLSDPRNFSSFREPHDIRHHHAPTVEDVLREFLDNFHDASCIEAEADVVAEYAAKLRLVGEDA